MTLQAFDHVNVRTTNLDAMVAWYDEILGLSSGWRPPFPFPGAWLYMGDRAVVHLVGVDGTPQAGGDLTLEHFAFRATGFEAFKTQLQDKGVAHSVDPVPGLTIVQINLHDPDGNHIHIDFDTAQEG